MTLPFLLSFFCCCSLLFFLIPILKRKLPDNPNSRSAHFQSIPRGGGLAFVVVSTSSSMIMLLRGSEFDSGLLPFVACPLAIVGLFDDRFNLPATWRFFFQFSTSILLVSLSPLFSRLGYNFAVGIFCLLIFIAFVVSAVINFTNFMDGLDGLVAGCMAVAIGAVSLALNSPWPLWALVGSLLGFLLWNWSPAKVFMGDVGSTYLGAVFAGLVLQASSWSGAFVYLLVATPLLGDACLCVPRRLFAGQRVFQAHRLHLFQRLHQAGWSHARVSLTYIAATAVLAAAMLTGGWPWVFGLAIVELLVGVWLDQRVAVPFAVASRS